MSLSVSVSVCVAAYVDHLGRPLVRTCVPEVRAVVYRIMSVFDVRYAVLWTMIDTGPPANNPGVGFYSTGATALLSCPVAVGDVVFFVAAKNALTITISSSFFYPVV